MTLIKKYKYQLITAFAFLLYVAFAYLFKIPCPIKYLSGVSCLGCGMTRACASLLRLDFATAFYYHPMVFVFPVFLLLMIVYSVKKKKRAFYITLSLCTVAFALTYLYRIVYNSDVISINIADGIIYKRIYALIEIFSS